MLAACGGSSHSGAGQGPDTGPGAVSVSAADLSAAATDIYGRVAAGAPIGDQLQHLFDLAGIRVLRASADRAEIERRAAAGERVAVDVQLQALEQGYQNGAFVTLDSFVADLVAKGFQAIDPAGPLTRDYLSSKLAPVAALQTYDRSNVLMGTILALGRARAEKAGGAMADPVWGDGLLDPLQFSLFGYGAFAANPSGASSAGVRSSSRLALVSADGPANIDVGDLPGVLIRSFWRFPMASMVMLCRDVIIDGSRISLTQSGPEVYRKGDGSPNEILFTAAVQFGPLDLDASVRAWLDTIHCHLPNPGPRPGVGVVWQLGSAAPLHGDWRETDERTDSSGQVSRHYDTKPEDVPPWLQFDSTRKKDRGDVSLAVWLASDDPLIETVFQATSYKNDVQTVKASFDIWHYELPKALSLSYTGSTTTQDGYVSISGTGEATLTLQGPVAAYYSGSGKFTHSTFVYTMPSSPDCHTAVFSNDGAILSTLAVDATNPNGLLSVYPAVDDPPYEQVNNSCAPQPLILQAFELLTDANCGLDLAKLASWERDPVNGSLTRQCTLADGTAATGQTAITLTVAQP